MGYMHTPHPTTGRQCPPASFISMAASAPSSSASRASLALPHGATSTSSGSRESEVDGASRAEDGRECVGAGWAEGGLAAPEAGRLEARRPEGGRLEGGREDGGRLEEAREPLLPAPVQPPAALPPISATLPPISVAASVALGGTKERGDGGCSTIGWLALRGTCPTAVGRRAEPVLGGEVGRTAAWVRRGDCGRMPS